MSFMFYYLKIKVGQKNSSHTCCADAGKVGWWLFSRMKKTGRKAFNGLTFILLSAVLFFCFITSAYPMDITLRWNANTESDLAGYKIYYKMGFPDSPYNGTGALEGASPIEVGKETEVTLHGLLDDEVYYFAVTAYDVESLESNYSNEVDALSITLHQGSNLISLYRQPDDTDVSSVLGPISGKYASIWTFIDNNWRVFDPSSPGFSDLTAMEAGRGYWIEMNEPAVLLTYGSAASNSINLVNGSNLVGYNSARSQAIAVALDSIDGKYVSVWTFIEGNWRVYDPANSGFSDLTAMEPGCGYWIDSTETCTWSVH